MVMWGLGTWDPSRWLGMNQSHQSSWSIPMVSNATFLKAFIGQSGHTWGTPDLPCGVHFFLALNLKNWSTYIMLLAFFYAPFDFLDT